MLTWASQEMRKRLTALSFSEKIKILEKLRGRSVTLAASGLRRKSTGVARNNADADAGRKG
jgi:hypothetical protein